MVIQLVVEVCQEEKGSATSSTKSSPKKQENEILLYKRDAFRRRCAVGILLETVAGEMKLDLKMHCTLMEHRVVIL